jgi:Citrate transporter
VDWETLLFFVCIFVLVGALEKTGVIGALGKAMGESFGSNVVLASFLLLGGIGILSSIIPNIPLVVAMVPLVKEYAVGAGLATPAAIEAGYRQMRERCSRCFLQCAWAPHWAATRRCWGPHPISLPAASAHRTDAR